MLLRSVAIAAAFVAMLAFGFGVYEVADYLKAGRPHVQRPSETSVPALPGTMYVVQNGAIYRFHRGRFTQVTPEAGWMQPAGSPDGSELVAVRRQPNVSDVYLLAATGRVLRQLTHNSTSRQVLSHWSFYPRFSADGTQLFFSYDPKDPYNGYRVDLAIFASPADPGSRAPLQWTYPNPYTGGDVDPLPLQGGGLIFTRFSIDDQSKVHSQVWLQTGPGTAGVALTKPEADCLEPALSSDQKLLAMVCTNGSTEAAELQVASLNPSTFALGSPTVVVRGQLPASPAFSPDGATIAYLAPAVAGGPFQLWTVASAESAKAFPPRQITTDLALDSYSAPVWLAA
jgi:Tol biopolymer transport system component